MKKKDIINLEQKIWEFVDKNLLLIFFIIITFLSLFIRIKLINIESNDYLAFLSPWFDNLKENGGLSALKYYNGDYNIPYITILALLTYLPFPKLYMIKAVSIIFDYILAFAGMTLVYKLLSKNKKAKSYALLAYSLVVMAPTVILNSSAWGQCDSIFAAFTILSLIYLLDEKYTKSFILLGLAFAFKLQFIFILPAYILVYMLKRNFSVLNFLIIPIVNFVLCLPGIIAGKSILDCMTIYFNQAKLYEGYISLNFPGIYNLFLKGENLIYSSNPSLPNLGIILTIFVFIIFAFILLINKTKIQKEDIISISLWSILISTFLLPYMHDRYMFVADILSILYFIIYREKWYVPVGIILSSLYCYSSYLLGNISIPIAYVSMLNLIIICLLTKDILYKVLPKTEET